MKWINMKYIKYVVNKIIIIPNIPFLLILAIYILINIFRNTSETELEFVSDKELLTDEIKDWVMKIYPKYLTFLIAIIFYISIIIKVIQFYR